MTGTGGRGSTGNHRAQASPVAQRQGIAVSYLLGLSMRRVADMYLVTAKTDEKDAFIIADTALTMPHTLRNFQVSDEDEATLGMLTGLDLDWPIRSPRPATGSVGYSPKSTRL